MNKKNRLNQQVEKMKSFLYDHENELQLDTDFNDIVMEIERDYQDYGCIIMSGEKETNVFCLNFPGTSDWFYFISIPDDEIKDYGNLELDRYPIYFVNLPVCEITKEANNFKQFIKTLLPDTQHELLDFSDDYIVQDQPVLRIV